MEQRPLDGEVDSPVGRIGETNLHHHLVEGYQAFLSWVGCCEWCEYVFAALLQVGVVASELAVDDRVRGW